MSSMAGSGLLSLKWNNHRSTFFHILTTIRSKESYCDVTIACEGKFYPVHKLVLSTCSDYFEQMFARTNCKHPVIVLKDIRSQELEALLNYMYVGEVNVLQNDLAGLIKAAECLMIKGLAVPDEAPSKENKRIHTPQEEIPSSKRRRRDEEVRLPPPPAAPQSQPSRRELRDNPVSSQSQQRQSSSASVPTPSPAVPRLPPPNPISPAPSVGSTSESLPEECSQQGLADTCDQKDPGLVNAQEEAAEHMSSQSQDSLPEIILDEPGVKDEPQDIEEEMTDTKEIFEPLPFEHSGEGEAVGDQQGAAGVEATSQGPTAFDSQMLAAPPPQSMEELVAQAIPGSSGMQGNSMWEGEGSFPMEGFAGDASRPPQMGQQRQQGGLSRSDVVIPPALQCLQPQWPGSGTGSLGGGCSVSLPGSSDGGGGSQWSLDKAVGSTLYPCPVCSKPFNHRGNLKKHIRIHTGEKPYACQICSYRANQKVLLKMHVQKRHSEQASKQEQAHLLELQRGAGSGD